MVDVSISRHITAEHALSCMCSFYGVVCFNFPAPAIGQVSLFHFVLPDIFGESEENVTSHQPYDSAFNNKGSLNTGTYTLSSISALLIPSTTVVQLI